MISAFLPGGGADPGRAGGFHCRGDAEAARRGDDVLPAGTLRHLLMYRVPLATREKPPSRAAYTRLMELRRL